MTQRVHHAPSARAGLRERLERETAARRRAERRLRLLERALETTQIGVTITDTAGRIVYTNPADATMHGWTPGELVDKDVGVFSPQADRRPLDLDDLRNVTSWARESINVRRDGSAFAVRLLSDLVRDAEGEPIGLVTTCEDITLRKHDEAELVESRSALEEQLRQSQKLEAIGQLTSGIAHDFNNLLSVILTNGELLVSALPSGRDDSQSLLSDLLAAGRSAARVVEQLLGFSRKAELRLAPIDLRDLVPAATQLWRHVIPETIAIETSVTTEPVTVRGDQNAIGQMLINLVTNARDAMPNGGRIGVEVTATTLDGSCRRTHPWVVPGQYACVAVSDSGVGMDEKTKARIFEPFFTTKPPGKGTGLGLSMVYGLVKQHRGFIHVYSEPGAGTTVKLYFPAVRQPARPVTGAQPARVEPPLGGTERVLLAEDEPSLRRGTQRALERLGYTVLVAADGAEALDLFRAERGRVDLVVSDLIMPRLGGRELYAAVRAEGGTTPFLFSSGYSANDAEERSGTPDVPCLAKPWSLADLARLVREVLDRAVPVAMPEHAGGAAL